ncbi:MAG: hypothetical protein EHM81_04125 [Chloroflexi bacterium]|nr:MAG: hypothetical protein EHM81_04125 [Chloroflexota bacterium]
MTSSNSTGLLVLCGFFIVFAMMIGFAVYTIRKEKAQKEKFAAEMGFSPVTETRELLERLAFVNERSRPGLLHLTNVYRRPAGGGDVYMYSMHRRNYDENGVRRGKRASKSHYSPLETDAFAFISPAWKLPGFKAAPRLAGEGKLAAMANRLAEKVVETFSNRVEFPHIPGLDEKYFIATIDATEISLNLPDSFLQALAASPGLSIHAGGDTFTVSLASVLNRDEEKIKQLYKTAIRLARELQAR